MITVEYENCMWEVVRWTDLGRGMKAGLPLAKLYTEEDAIMFAAAQRHVDDQQIYAEFG
jgi:hypothetical protein